MTTTKLVTVLLLTGLIVGGTASATASQPAPANTATVRTTTHTLAAQKASHAKPAKVVRRARVVHAAHPAPVAAVKVTAPVKTVAPAKPVTPVKAVTPTTASPAPVLTPVEAAPPVWHDVSCANFKQDPADPATVDLPDAGPNVIYALDSIPSGPGTYLLSPGVHTVTANQQPGYTVTGVTDWAFTVRNISKVC
jgi:hypothetical protein